MRWSAALRSRNRLLEQPNPDTHWLDAIEHETAEVAIAVAAARAETVRRLAAALLRDRDPASPFPWAGVALDGWVENALMEQPATEVEDRYRAVLRDNRARDAAAGRTTDGPHLTDLDVLYGPKGIAAAQASTGEQKALLIGLVLAHAGLVAAMTGFAPLLLLDEVIAHLDPGAARRALRRARRAGRTGVDDRRRSGAVRRCRGARAECSRSAPDASSLKPAAIGGRDFRLSAFVLAPTRCRRLRRRVGPMTFCWQIPPAPLIVARHCWNVAKAQTIVQPP